MENEELLVAQEDTGFEDLSEESELNPVEEGFAELYKQQNAFFSEDNKATNTSVLLTTLAMTNKNKPISYQINEEALKATRDSLEKGEEKVIRHTLAYDKTQEQLANLNKLREEFRFSPDPKVVQQFDDAYNNVLQADYDKKSKIAIEEAALERIQLMAASGDSVQARVLMDQLVNGNAEQTKHAFNVKLAIMMQRRDELESKYQNSGWGKFLLNTALSVIPVNYNFARTGIMGTAGFWDLFTVGSTQRKESGMGWNLPLGGEFEEAWAQNGSIMQSINENATSIFDMVDDPGIALEIMEDMIAMSDSKEDWNNIWGGVEIASVVPYATIGKAISGTRFLIAAGDAKSAVRNLGNALDVLDAQGPEAMVRATGVTEKELVEELSVSAIRGERGSVPLIEPLVAHKEAAQKVVDEFLNTPNFAKFASMEELQAAVLGRIDELKVTYGSHIKDVHIAPTTLPSGQIVNKIVFSVGKKDGFLYATKAAAKRGLKSMGRFGETLEASTVRTVPRFTPESTVTLKSSVTTDGKTNHLIDIVTKDGDEIPVTIKVDDATGEGVIDVRGLSVNDLGPKEVRAIAAKLADDIPNLKVLKGPRSTGARAKARIDNPELDDVDAVVDVTGLRGQTETVRDMSGQWFNKITVDMPEAGWLVGKLEPEQRGYIGRTLGRWFSASPRISDPFLHGKALEAGSYLNRVSKHIANEAMGVFRNLGPEAKKVVGALGELGSIRSRNFTRTEVDVLVQRQWGRRATEVEHAAYEDLLKFNDADWLLRNDVMYLNAHSQGKETVTFKAKWGEDFEDLDVKVNYKMDTVPTDRVYDASRGKHYVRGRNSLDSKTLETMKNNGYVMLDVPGFTLPEGIVVNHVLIKKIDIQIKPLKTTQLPYAEGGHRMYTSRYFVKQGREGVQSDTGSKYLLSPLTHRTTDNLAEGTKWGDTMDLARVARKDNPSITAQEIEDDIFKNDKMFPTGEEFLNDVIEGKIDLDNPFETVFDRDMPKMYQSSGEDIARMFDDDELGINGYYRTTGRMYTSSKGDILRHTSGELAEVLDPFDTLSKSLSQVSRQIGLQAYKQNALERFQNTYKQFMLTDANVRSPAAFLLESRINPTISVDMKNQIESQRNAILNVMRFETEADRTASQMYQSMAESVLGDGDNFMRKVAHDAVYWWKDASPISSLRGIAFDSKLGMFNPGQLLIQASTMVSATALSPKFGMRGMMGLLPMHAYILKRGSENVLDLMTKRGTWKSMGFDTADEFKEYARHAFKHGFMEMNGSHVMINNYGPNAHFGSFGEKQLRAREQARVFFYTSEVWNRLVAYRIAWGETTAKGLTPNDPQFNATILRLADDYSMNMTSESAAFWQKGVLSLPTQFWAYNARMIEAMFGKRFTPAQRVRLIGVNMLIAGSAGVPGLQAVSEYVKQKHGGSPDLDSIKGIADRGVIDYINYQATGNDILIGERVATGGWASDVVKSIFGASEYGQKSFAELAGGATYSITKNTSKTLMNLAKYSVAESGAEDAGEITKENVLNVLKEVSTFGNMTKAVIVAQTGMWKSNTGGILAADLPSGTSVYAALSFRPAKADEIGYRMAYLKDRKESVDEVAKKLRNWRQEAVNTGDYEKYWSKANILIRMIPPQDRKEVLKRTNNITDASFYDYVDRKVTEEQEEEKAMEGLE